MREAFLLSNTKDLQSVGWIDAECDRTDPEAVTRRMTATFAKYADGQSMRRRAGRTV